MNGVVLFKIKRFQYIAKANVVKQRYTSRKIYNP